MNALPCLCAHRYHRGRPCNPRTCGCGTYRPDTSPGAWSRLLERERAMDVDAFTGEVLGGDVGGAA